MKNRSNCMIACILLVLAVLSGCDMSGNNPAAITPGGFSTGADITFDANGLDSIATASVVTNVENSMGRDVSNNVKTILIGFDAAGKARPVVFQDKDGKYICLFLSDDRYSSASELAYGIYILNIYGFGVSNEMPSFSESSSGMAFDYEGDYEYYSFGSPVILNLNTKVAAFLREIDFGRFKAMDHGNSKSFWYDNSGLDEITYSNSVHFVHGNNLYIEAYVGKGMPAKVMYRVDIDNPTEAVPMTNTATSNGRYMEFKAVNSSGIYCKIQDDDDYSQNANYIIDINGTGRKHTLKRVIKEKPSYTADGYFYEEDIEYGIGDGYFLSDDSFYDVNIETSSYKPYFDREGNIVSTPFSDDTMIGNTSYKEINLTYAGGFHDSSLPNSNSNPYVNNFIMSDENGYFFVWAIDADAPEGNVLEKDYSGDWVNARMPEKFPAKICIGDKPYTINDPLVGWDVLYFADEEGVMYFLDFDYEGSKAYVVRKEYILDSNGEKIYDKFHEGVYDVNGNLLYTSTDEMIRKGESIRSLKVADCPVKYAGIAAKDDVKTVLSVREHSIDSNGRFSVMRESAMTVDIADDLKNCDIYYIHEIGDSGIYDIYLTVRNTVVEHDLYLSDMHHWRLDTASLAFEYVDGFKYDPAASVAHLPRTDAAQTHFTQDGTVMTWLDYEGWLGSLNFNTGKLQRVDMPTLASNDISVTEDLVFVDMYVSGTEIGTYSIDIENLDAEPVQRASYKMVIHSLGKLD